MLRTSPTHAYRSCPVVVVILLLVWASGVAGQARDGQPRRGHVITGAVRSASGEPVANVFVTALIRDDEIAVRLRGRDGVDRPYRFVSAQLGTTTDSSGRYSLELPYAGEFYLAALPRQMVGQGRRPPQRSGFGNTFYPNVSRFLEARSVRIRPGDSVNADITLVTAPLSVVSGTVFDSNGMPLRGGRLLIVHGDGFFGLNGLSTTVTSEGRFLIPNMQPGTYFLQFRESEWPPPRGTVPVVSQARVVVSGTDVQNVRVLPMKPVAATGRVVIDGGDGPLPSEITVSAFPVPVDGNPGPGLAGVVTAAMTFEFRTWPMPVRIRVDVRRPGWTVKTVRLNGREVPDGIVDFGQHPTSAGLEIVLTPSARAR